jgi:hypothetical protein
MIQKDNSLAFFSDYLPGNSSYFPVNYPRCSHQI